MNETEPIGYVIAHQMVETIFRQQLPAHGMAMREGQIKLCHAMLNALYNKEAALCDAGVGLGKTYAYLAACLLWQSQRPRALWQPVVISTASVALQEAILQEYIPFLSSMLLQYGYFNRPIQAVLRKGKERFVCDLRLLERQRQMAQRGERFARRAAILRQALDCLDLDKLPGLSGFDRRQICVPEHCPRLCPMRSRCRYQRYLRESNGPAMSIQVCNHNYLLADALHRQNGWRPLLRDYQAVVIDEAHRLPEATEQMLTHHLSARELHQLAHRLEQQHLTRGAQQLRAATEALAAACQPQTPNRTRANRQVPYQPAPERQAALTALQTCIGELLRRYPTRLPLSLRHQLQAASETAALFARPQEDWIAYIEYDAASENQTNTPFALCAVPRDQPGYLHELLWQREKPAILTSGTLAAGDDFTHIRRRLGLGCSAAVQAVQVASPFDYVKNCLLVFLPRTAARQMDRPNEEATPHERLARQIEQLIRTAHGHTLVLFTSYDQMGRVYERLEGRLPVPLFKAPRGGQWFVEQFKHCKNAVLLAGGPCWEGVDFPGDLVSLLVIVRLPFPVPDPVREARREQYPDLRSYIQAEIVPEMQQKLRQGFGRAIRTETDSCAVAILDPRAAPGGRYHRAVMDALPAGIPVTTEINEIQTFLRARKGPDFFLPDFEHDSKQTDSKTNAK
ncbi:ATP-dependent DNA helicase [Gemmiger sp.]|uniref:ATP-dependent DNA helicase n=1 Tax=Gemmiger sp. TaxID=2049027 RepID=UPI003F0742A5